MKLWREARLKAELVCGRPVASVGASTFNRMQLEISGGGGAGKAQKGSPWSDAALSSRDYALLA